MAESHRHILVATEWGLHLNASGHALVVAEVSLITVAVSIVGNGNICLECPEIDRKFKVYFIISSE